MNSSSVGGTCLIGDWGEGMWKGLIFFMSCFNKLDGVYWDYDWLVCSTDFDRKCFTGADSNYYPCYCIGLDLLIRWLKCILSYLLERGWSDDSDKLWFYLITWPVWSSNYSSKSTESFDLLRSSFISIISSYSRVYNGKYSSIFSSISA